MVCLLLAVFSLAAADAVVGVILACVVLQHSIVYIRILGGVRLCVGCGLVICVNACSLFLSQFLLSLDCPSRGSGVVAFK